MGDLGHQSRHASVVVLDCLPEIPWEGKRNQLPGSSYSVLGSLVIILIRTVIVFTRLDPILGLSGFVTLASTWTNYASAEHAPLGGVEPSTGTTSW